MALQGYADQPCPSGIRNPPPQYVSQPWITPDSRRLNPLDHHDWDNIACELPFWTVLVSWYPNHGITTSHKPNLAPYLYVDVGLQTLTALQPHTNQTQLPTSM